MVLDRGGVFETSKLTQVFEDLKSINNLGFSDRFSAFRTYESWAQMLVENKDLFRMVTGALYQEVGDSAAYEKLSNQVSAYIDKYFMAGTCLVDAFKTF